MSDQYDDPLGPDAIAAEPQVSENLASLELRPLRLRWWQSLALVVSCVTFLLVAVLGPWLLLQNTSSQAKQVANTNTVVNYIHQIQTGPQSTASREATSWFVAEFQVICAANPRCKAVPFPRDLANLLGEGVGGASHLGAKR